MRRARAASCGGVRRTARRAPRATAGRTPRQAVGRRAQEGGRRAGSSRTPRATTGKTPRQAVGRRVLEGGRRLAGSSRTPCAIVRTLRRWHRIGHAARGSPPPPPPPPPPAAVSQSVRKDEGRKVRVREPSKKAYRLPNSARTLPSFLNGESAPNFPLGCSKS